MAGADRMTIEEVVRKVLLDQHADVIREAVKAVAGEVDGARGVRADRPRAWRAPARGPRDAPQQRFCSRPAVGHQGRRDRVAGSPRSARAAISQASWSRAGARSGRCWRSCSRRMCAASRGGHVDQLVESLPGCGSQRARSAESARRLTSMCTRSGRGRWRAATRTFSVLRREGREGARWRPRRQQGVGDRARRARERPARDPRARRRRVRDRSLLDRA